MSYKPRIVLFNLPLRTQNKYFAGVTFKCNKCYQKSEKTIIMFVKLIAVKTSEV